MYNYIHVHMLWILAVDQCAGFGIEASIYMFELDFRVILGLFSLSFFLNVDMDHH